jgi:hypothetical protein
MGLTGDGYTDVLYDSAVDEKIQNLARLVFRYCSFASFGTARKTELKQASEEFVYTTSNSVHRLEQIAFKWNDSAV